MQLAKLVRFNQHVLENLSAIDADSCAVFYFWDGEWRSLPASPQPHTDLISDLERTKRVADKHHRRTKNVRSFYWLPEIDAVVAVDSAAPTKKSTRIKTLRALAEFLRYSHATFDARHDDLTGINNRRAFQEVVVGRLTALVNQPSTPEQSRVASEATQCLLSIDIDYFKQVNDSYGHPYGDDVLRCFASRLSALADRLNSPEVFAYCARLGGEEFALFLDGKVSRSEVSRIADEITTISGSGGLFTEPEWRHRAEAASRPLAARMVSASVGISSFGAARPGSDNENTLAAAQLTRMTSESDQALYRAKQGGRRCHRFFSDIRDQFGAVLERHESTNIICIDIGKRVDVAPGNEFLVFHPDFRGGQALEVQDGRSRRELGKRPRVHSGRIVVFDVQDEISFATIKQESPDRAIQKGCMLAFVPLGFTSHLTGNSAETGGAAVEKLNEALALGSSRRQHTATALFTIANLPDFQATAGIASVNEALANLDSAVTRSFRDMTIVRLDTGTYGVVIIGADVANLSTTTTEVVSEVSRAVSAPARFCCGYFVPPLPYTAAESAANAPQARDGLNYASLALDLARKRRERVIQYGDGTAGSLVFESRRVKRYGAGIADYVEACRVGIKSGSLENQAALCYYESKEPDLLSAERCARRAVEYDPDESIYRANLAAILVAKGEYDEAHAIFERLQAANFQLSPEYEPDVKSALANRTSGGHDSNKPAD